MFQVPTFGDQDEPSDRIVSWSGMLLHPPTLWLWVSLCISYLFKFQNMFYRDKHFFRLGIMACLKKSSRDWKLAICEKYDAAMARKENYASSSCNCIYILPLLLQLPNEKIDSVWWEMWWTPRLLTFMYFS